MANTHAKTGWEVSGIVPLYRKEDWLCQAPLRDDVVTAQGASGASDMPLCASCGQTQGKRQFSQNQLSKGDRARCKRCVTQGTALKSSLTESNNITEPNYTIAHSANGGVSLSGDMSDQAIHAFCIAAGWVEGSHVSGVAQSQTPRFVFRGLRANECLDGVTQPWQLAPAPPRREGLRAKSATPIGLMRALQEGSAVSNEFVHCSVSPVAAVFYAAAFHAMGTCARVVKIDLGAIPSESVIDVSSVDGCRARGIAPRSIAENFAVAHEVILLSDPVPPTAIVAVYDVSWVRDLPRGERQTCSLNAYTEKIPKLLLSEIKAWAGPSCVKDLPEWLDLFELPLKHLWRAENARQLHMYGRRRSGTTTKIAGSSMVRSQFLQRFSWSPASVRFTSRSPSRSKPAS